MQVDDEVTNQLLHLLEDWEPYIYHKALTGSVYIKFPHWGLGSIRIGDHPGRNKYTYRWRVNIEDNIGVVYGTHKNIGYVEVDKDNLHILVGKFVMEATRRKIKPGDKQKYSKERRRPNERTN